MKIAVQVTDSLVPHLDLLKEYADGPLEFTRMREDASDLISRWHNLSPIYHSWSIGMPYEEHSSRVSFAEYIGADYFSIAIGHPCEKLKVGEITVAGSRLFSRDEFFRISNERLSLFKENFKHVSVENLDYNDGEGKISAYELANGEKITTPEFINEYVEKMGVDLLLDLGHAEISAERERLMDRYYLIKLLLERVYEIHFNHPTKVNGVTKDTHQPPTDHEYNLLETILLVAKPKYITLEMKTDFKTYLTELKRLRKWLDKQ